MTAHSPVHPEVPPIARGGDRAPHEILDDVVGDEQSSKAQRWIGWICGLLTLAAAVAFWRLA